MFDMNVPRSNKMNVPMASEGYSPCFTQTFIISMKANHHVSDMNFPISKMATHHVRYEHSTAR